MKDSPSILSPSSSRFSGWNRTEASVLLITLSFILLLTVIAVAFLVRSRSSLQTSQSYTKEIVAQEIGEIVIDKLAAEFQDEINTARSSANQILLPPRVGAITNNPRTSALVRRTVGDMNLYASGYSTAGFSSPPHANRASTISTTNVAKNGWRFDKERWFAPGLLRSTETNAFVPPDWVYIYRTQTTNPSDIIGRYAAVVYDVGGLLDVNVAGVPSGVSLGDKGSVAFSDLSAMDDTFGTTLATKLPAWRFAGSATDETAFYGKSTMTDPTKAGRLESPKVKVDAGENQFFSRMELVEAAKAKKFGLSEDLLPFLRTRSESANHVSVENLFAEGTATTMGLADNKLAASKDTTFTIDRIDGTQDTYTIKAGWPLIQNRFPLARLRWLADRAADGTPRHLSEIKKYFGLTWNSSDKLFVYTSPDRATPANEIKTLVDLVKEINNGTISVPREPDFFEWLKAGINPNSLGQTGGDTYRALGSSGWETSKDLHVLRIGANVIDQADPDSIPTGIRSSFNGSFDSFGCENLPYINEVVVTAKRREPIAGSSIDGYFQFELWNPHQTATTHMPVGFDRKPLKLRVGVLSGRALMLPVCFIKDRQPFDHGNPNPTWSNQVKLVQASIDALGAANLSSDVIAGQTISFELAGSAFGEPAIASTAGADTSNAIGYPSQPDRPIIRVGAPPQSGFNAIRVATAPGDVPGGYGAKPLSSFYPELVQGDGTAILKDGTILPSTHNFFKAGNPVRAYNSVVFTSDGSLLYNVNTDPITFLLDIEAEDGTRFPVGRYHNLALGRHRDTNGITQMILSDDENTTEATKGASMSRWVNNASDISNSCFSNWLDYTIRRGYFMSDARTERFGLAEQVIASPGAGVLTHPVGWNGAAAWGSNYNMVSTLYGAPGKADQNPNSDALLSHWKAIQQASGQYVGVSAALARNFNGDDIATYYYEDPDGAVRRADAGWVSRDAHPALPVTAYSDDLGNVYPQAKSSRPVFLDRPFRNVAELGCVFRDIPWKSLDLFSPDSADRRLLDVFSIEDRKMVTGKINPNLASADVFKSLLRKASTNPSSSGSSLVSDTDASSIAKMFAALNPEVVADQVHNGANMAERLSKDVASMPGGSFSPYKIPLENFIRTLSSVTDTRSWQLMCDIVVQSGRISSQSSNLRDFLVEGQKRFFVYLTLDRITGEILDKHIEPVYE